MSIKSRLKDLQYLPSEVGASVFSESLAYPIFVLNFRDLFGNLTDPKAYINNLGQT